MPAKKTARKTAKKPVQRIPVYKDASGAYVGIDERRMELAWYIPELEDFGYVFQNEDKALDEESGVALEEIRRFFKDKGRSFNTGEVFSFDSMSEARACLRRVNAALWAWKNLNKEKMPDWAMKAIEAGWSPPKGWTPT